MSHTQLQGSFSLTIKHLFQNVVNVKCKIIKAAEDCECLRLAVTQKGTRARESRESNFGYLR